MKYSYHTTTPKFVSIKRIQNSQVLKIKILKIVTKISRFLSFRYQRAYFEALILLTQEASNRAIDAKLNTLFHITKALKEMTKNVAGILSFGDLKLGCQNC